LRREAREERNSDLVRGEARTQQFSGFLLFLLWGNPIGIATDRCAANLFNRKRFERFGEPVTTRRVLARLTATR
jgi:hypothetical protein